MDIDPDLEKLGKNYPKQGTFQCSGILIGITNRILEEFHCHLPFSEKVDIDPDLEKLSKNYQNKEFCNAAEF